MTTLFPEWDQSLKSMQSFAQAQSQLFMTAAQDALHSAQTFAQDVTHNPVQAMVDFGKRQAEQTVKFGQSLVQTQQDWMAQASSAAKPQGKTKA